MGVLRDAIIMFCISDPKFENRKISELTPELRIGGEVVDIDEFDKRIEAVMQKKIDDDRAYILSEIASLMLGDGEECEI